jgi:hypothetical protein
VSEDRERFLARWSRRKAGIASPLDERRELATPAPPTPPAVPAVAPAPVAEPAANNDAAEAASASPAPPLPTLADVAALTRDSDYTRFMAPGVDRSVRNAAMKKLFSDPRFNVMDRLDVYIDDYNTPDPLPLEMLKQLRQSEMLGLFRDDAAAQQPPDAAAEATPDNAGITAAASPTPVPSAPPTDAIPRAEDDPDLRLQPDDGDRRPGAGQGARD